MLDNTKKQNVLDRIKVIQLNPKEFKEDDGKTSDHYTYHSAIKNICIITEDRGNGFQFYMSYLHYNYPDIRGALIGAVGNKSIAYIIEEYNDYDEYVIILDAGISPNEFRGIKLTIQSELRENTKVYFFTPNCLEEVLLSFTKMEEYINVGGTHQELKLMKGIHDVVEGNTDSIDYKSFISLELITKEKVCEKFLYDITKGTVLEAFHGQRRKKGVSEYIPAYLSPCWRCECCEVSVYDKDNKINPNNCKKPGYKGKTDIIAKNSLLCGFTYIIDKIYGNHYHDVYWNKIDQDYFNSIVKEVTC